MQDFLLDFRFLKKTTKIFTTFKYSAGGEVIFLKIFSFFSPKSFSWYFCTFNVLYGKLIVCELKQ